MATLDPDLYGIIVRCGERQALLLPGIDEIVTPEQQLRAACEKAGIDRFAPLQVERFRSRTIECSRSWPIRRRPGSMPRDIPSVPHGWRVVWPQSPSPGVA